MLVNAPQNVVTKFPTTNSKAGKLKLVTVEIEEGSKFPPTYCKAGKLRLVGDIELGVKLPVTVVKRGKLRLVKLDTMKV